jgi:hypothetical protein
VKRAVTTSSNTGHAAALEFARYFYFWRFS